MFRRSAFAAAVLVALAPAAAAEDAAYFANDTVRVGRFTWHVWGEPHTKDKDLLCKAGLDFDDGSYFLIGRDFDQDNIYIYLHDTQWEVSPDKFPWEISVQMNAFSRNGELVRHGEMVAGFVDKNSITIPELDGKDVYDVLARAATIRFVMPDNISNASIPSPGRAVAHKLAECFTAAQKMLDDKGAAAFAAPSGKKRD